MPKSFNRASIGFYRPHARVEERGEVTNPVTGEVTRPPTMTKQAHRDECDINNILKQYRATGVIRHISAKAQQGQYMDLPDPMEFQDALHIVMQSEDAFASLPSTVRSRFHNDPGEFLQFISNPANRDEAQRLGLLKDQPPPQAQAQAGATPPPPAPNPPPSPGAGGTGG